MLMDNSGTIWLQSLGRTATYVDTERDSFVQMEKHKGEFNYFALVDGEARYNRGSMYSEKVIRPFYDKKALKPISLEEKHNIAMDKYGTNVCLLYTSPSPRDS